MWSRYIVGTAVASVLLSVVALAAGGKPEGAPQAGAAAKPAPAPPAAPVTAKPAEAGAPAKGTGADANRFFETDVRPILQAKFISCHSGESAQGGLKLTTRAAVLKGGASGPAVSMAKLADSLFLSAIHYKGKRMPPQGKLPPAQLDVLTRWVNMGLPWPEGPAASLEPQSHHGPPQVNAETRKFWAFQPVRRPAVPRVKRQAWVRNPIDAFVLARLEAKGLGPNPTATRAALIRRAYYDLIGLPPTPAEVEQFVADTSPHAWEKLVDRLLASPQYGEKWGRHWLDLVRYAETNSYERDGAKPNAWRYRDYVIRSFNADKPYDQFIQEQLAGDELAERTPERLIATGFYRLGLWDDEPADPELALYDDLDDIANTTGSVFLGLTVGCARCHDHKLDPFPQKDYYRFLAFFNGVNRYGVRGHDSVEKASLRYLTPEAEAAKHRELVTAYRGKMRANGEKIYKVEARIYEDLTPVEKQDWATEARRIPIIKERITRLVTQEEFDSYLRLVEERAQLRMSAPPSMEQALAVTEVGAKPRDTFILLRGNAHARGEKVEPGFPTVLGAPEPKIQPEPRGESSGRRLALARWIGSKENPLTARVMANRMWHYHFGRGIVRSTSNFGLQGDKPTHPELLDWLASEFTAQGWRMKPLHRMIMLSNTYKMSSRANPAALAKDPENDLFWRFDMRRLQAEEIRDSILAIIGSLNPKMGGPSFYPTIPAEVLAGQSMPGDGWGKSSAEEQARRSVYIFVKRSLAVPIIAAFDAPETDFTCPSRFATTQPTQALGMLNSAWTNEQARSLAAYLKKHAGERTADQVQLALARVL
ncbi:MAG TPA: PSD1 and planctomycete cytochrome C domain-containing protein, partial [Armatimonadota bacterium]|nr:PSD1 and planctomycete cytochrome C domain-containing protein [Armatimonadota bacterium]